jgi:ribosomal protein L18E
MKKYTNLSRRKIKSKVSKKTNPEIIETLNHALRHKAWLEAAKLISGSRRKYEKVNLSEINEKAEEGDVVVIIGKVLSLGEITKKIKIRAISFSKQAEEKMKKEKIDYDSVLNEINNNKKAEGVKILN